jgi:hypothetical protein
MLGLVITGGQTGAEQAAWAAARRAGIATGGYMSGGFATEDGPSPRIAALYEATELRMSDARRVRANLRRSGGLLWLGDPNSPEGRATLDACRELEKPFFTAQPESTPPATVLAWLRVFEFETLMISGNSASRSPGLARQVEIFLDRVFTGLSIRSA